MIVSSKVNKLLTLNFFNPINFLYPAGQHLMYCSGKIEIRKMIKNVFKS